MNHVRIYKFCRYRRKYRLSYSKRFDTIEEARKYVTDRVHAYMAFYNVMGYCYWPEDRLEIV